MDFKILNLPTKEIYQDLFQPSTKRVGEALSTVLDVANLILLPIKLLNEKSRIYFNKNIENYAKKLDKNDNLTLTHVPPNIGLQIIDKLTYLDQNELSEAFINLLAKASFEEYQNLTHPAFISILNNLSVDEAKILFNYKNSDRIPYIDVDLHRYVEKVEKPDENKKSLDNLRLMIDYTFQDKESVFLPIAWNLTGIEKDLDLIFPQNIDIYIENLHHNGLIYFEKDNYYKVDVDKYERLQNEIYKEVYEEAGKEIEKVLASTDFKCEIITRKRSIKFTELGQSFLKACIKEL